MLRRQPPGSINEIAANGGVPRRFGLVLVMPLLAAVTGLAIIFAGPHAAGAFRTALGLSPLDPIETGSVALPAVGEGLRDGLR